MAIRFDFPGLQFCSGGSGGGTEAASGVPEQAIADRPAERDDSSDDDDDDGGGGGGHSAVPWFCAACTYENLPLVGACAICGQPDPQARLRSVAEVRKRARAAAHEAKAEACSQERAAFLRDLEEDLCSGLSGDDGEDFSSSTEAASGLEVTATLGGTSMAAIAPVSRRFPRYTTPRPQDAGAVITIGTATAPVPSAAGRAGRRLSSLEALPLDMALHVLAVATAAPRVTNVGQPPNALPSTVPGEIGGNGGGGVCGGVVCCVAGDLARLRLVSRALLALAEAPRLWAGLAKAAEAAEAARVDRGWTSFLGSAGDASACAPGGGLLVASAHPAATVAASAAVRVGAGTREFGVRVTSFEHLGQLQRDAAAALDARTHARTAARDTAAAALGEAVERQPSPPAVAASSAASAATPALSLALSAALPTAAATPAVAKVPALPFIARTTGVGGCVARVAAAADQWSGAPSRPRTEPCAAPGSSSSSSSSSELTSGIGTHGSRGGSIVTTEHAALCEATGEVDWYFRLRETVVQRRLAHGFHGLCEGWSWAAAALRRLLWRTMETVPGGPTEKELAGGGKSVGSSSGGSSGSGGGSSSVGVWGRHRVVACGSLPPPAEELLSAAERATLGSVLRKLQAADWTLLRTAVSYPSTASQASSRVQRLA